MRKAATSPICVRRLVFRKVTLHPKNTSPMRCSTPMMRTTEKSNFGYSDSSSPSPNSTPARRTTRPSVGPSGPPRCLVPSRAYTKLTPTINRKNGKMRSVGVQPFHSACSSGG